MKTNKLERTFKGTLAAMLLALLVTLGGLAATHNDPASSLASSTSGAVSSQQVSTTNPVAVATTGTLQAQSTSAGLAQTGVVDARYAVQQTGQAVVTIINTMQATTTTRGRYGNSLPGQSQAQQASGSGVIIDSRGYIVTNQHVVADQQSLQVIFADGSKASATLVGQDAYTDIAVIKVDAKVPAVAQFGDSDKLELGQPVVAIGTALGDFANTVTEGIVSGMHRQITDASTSVQNLIQTDAAINHGNSGGPLLDLNGAVIGINTAVVRNDGTVGSVAEGLGFAIPSNTVKTVVDQLMKSGSISHPYIGISYEPNSAQIAQDNSLSTDQGIFITDVASGSPAAKASIQPNSVVTKLDGVSLSGDTASTLSNLLSKYKVGDSVKLIVIAPGATTANDITVVLAERPSGQ